MSFLNKLGIGVGAGAGAGRSISRPVPSDGRPRISGTAPTTAVGATRAPDLRESTRVSNGLKEFLWTLDGLGRGALLDLGPAWQTTLSFFIERGFRVSSEDILREWKEFRVEEEARRYFGPTVYETVIPRNIKLGEAPSHGQPIIHYDIGSSGADAYLRLTQEVLAHGTRSSRLRTTSPS